MSEAEEIENEDGEEEIEEAEPEPAPKPKRKQKAAGLGAAPAPRTPSGGWQSKDLELLWPEILDRLKKTGKTPYDIDMMVLRTNPPPQMAVGRTISGSSLVGSGSQTPGDAILKIIDEHYHLPSATGPADYNVRFIWHTPDASHHVGQIYAQTTVSRPGPDEIHSARRAAAYAPQVGYGQPPQQFQQPWPQQPQWQPPPQQWGSPQGYGAPPPMGESPELISLRMQNAQLSGQLTAILEHLKSQGNPMPAGLAAPPPAQPMAPPPWYNQPPPGYGAPSQQVPVQVAMKQRLRETLADLQDLKALQDTIQGMFGGGSQAEGVGAVPTVEAPAEGPQLPFDVIDIPGTKNKYALNRETRDIDWKGTAMSNMEQMMPTIHKVAEGVGELLKQVAKQAGAPDSMTGVGAPQQLPAAETNGAVGYPNV